jgi:hypothetical protein
MNFLLPLLFVFSVFAAEEKRFDFDQNGKDDFVEVYRKGKLVETHYDSDEDGKFDRHTILDSDSDVFKIIDHDKTNSQPHKRMSFTNNELLKKTIVHVQVDEDNDGVFEISYEMSTDIDQKRDTCAVASPGEIDRFSAHVLAACMRAEEYTRTDFGYRVHKSCTQGKNWVMPLIRESINEGLACLTRLKRQGMRGAARNLSSLQSILSRNNVQVICSEPGYNWTGTAAHATTGTERAREQLPLVHPGISMGPSMFTGVRNAKTNKYFKSTLFHEQLHNIGNRHGVEPEISYTCSACCFPENDKATAAACKVCGGDYSSITDPEYIRDITAFGQVSYSTNEALLATHAYLQEHVGSNFGLSYLATNTGGIFEPVGNELARALSLSRNLTGGERVRVNNLLSNADYAPLQPYRPGGRVVAEAYLKLYRDGDAAAAINHLRRNANLLKQQMALRSGENGKYMAANIKENVDKIIDEVWLNGFRGRAPQTNSIDALSRTTYDVKTLLGL